MHSIEHATWLTESALRLCLRNQLSATKGSLLGTLEVVTSTGSCSLDWHVAAKRKLLVLVSAACPRRLHRCQFQRHNVLHGGARVVGNTVISHSRSIRDKMSRSSVLTRPGGVTPYHSIYEV